MKKIQLQIVIIVCILFIFSGTCYAESASLLDVSPGYEGVMLSGEKVPVDVTIKAGDEDFVGRLRISYRDEDEDITVRSEQEVEISKGSEKIYSLPLMVERDIYTYQLDRFLLVELLDKSGRVAMTKVVGITELVRNDDIIVGVLSDRYAGFTYFNLASIQLMDVNWQNGSGDLNTIKLQGKNLENQAYLESLDFLVIDGMEYKLSSQALSNLRDWVEKGGRLVLSTGDQYATQGDIKTLFDLEDYRELKTINLEGTEDVLAIPFDMASFDESKVNQGIYSKVYGQGALIVSSYSFSSKQILSETENVDRVERIFGDLLMTRGLENEINPEDHRNLRNVLNRIPKEDMPSVQLIMYIMFAYLLCIGPVGYYILKKRGLTVYYWRMVSILAVIGTVVVFVAGKGIEFNKTVVNGITMIDQRSQTTQTTSFLGIKHSGVGKVMIQPQASQIKWSGSYAYGEAPKERTYFYTGDEAVEFSDIKKFQFVNMMVQNELEIDNVDQQLVLGQEGGRFVITNPFDTPLVDLVIIASNSRQYIPRIEPGESIEIASEAETFSQQANQWDYYDFYDSLSDDIEDLYQKNNAIQAFFYSNGRDRFAFGKNMIVLAWLEENTSQTVAVNGVDTLVTGKSLWVDEIEFTQPESGSVLLSNGMISPEIQLTGEAYFDHYDYSFYGYGDVFFNYEVPVWLEDCKVTIHLDQRIGLDYKIYDYDTETWVPMTTSGNEVTVEASQLSEENTLQFKVTNNSGDTFYGPSLDVEGVVAND